MSRYALWAVFGPLAWVGWGLLIGCAFSLGRGRRARRVAHLAFGSAALWWLIVYASPLGFALIEPLETRFPQPSAEQVAGVTDILVLAGGEHLAAAARHHRPEYGEHGDRVIGAAMLAGQLPRAHLWAVGGIRPFPGAPRDIDWTSYAWRTMGIAPPRVTLIGQTADTCENARGVAARLPRGARMALLTSAFHMPRAIACFRAVGLEPLPYPVDYLNGAGDGAVDGMSLYLGFNEEKVDLALHEYVGLAVYRLEGRTAEIWPAPKAASAARLLGS